MRRFLLFLCSLTWWAMPAAFAMVDLSHAVVVTPGDLTAPQTRAVALLREEVAKRTQLTWSLATPGQVTPSPKIYVGTFAGLHSAATIPLPAELKPDGLGPEGYAIMVDPTAKPAKIFVAGVDERGVLFGLGHLLRTLRLAPGQAEVEDALKVRSSPQFPIRGMQLGFRAMSNTYGNWGRSEFEQQIRDLAVFGCNAIELVAGFDREAPGDLTMPSIDNMAMVSELTASYGLDVWVWTPAREKDYADPAAVARTLAEWENIFRRLPRIDGIYVPSGDPGDTPPELLIPLVEKQEALLRKYHPRAKVWMSVQSFNRERLDYFFKFLQTQRPTWLTGVIYSSWNDLTMVQLRERVPERYALRSCIDIGHVLHCMYPVHELDTAVAIAIGREPVCPRPEAMVAVARAELPLTQGSIAYSDGVTDDINKTIWLQLNWNLNTAPADVLRDYGRYFIGDALGQDFARGAAWLEKNWQGALGPNPQVAATLTHFKALEKRATMRDRRNWRFLSALYRAYFDSYTQQRLNYETKLEADATAVLAGSSKLGAERAMREAETILDRAVRQPVATPERTRIFQLGEALFQTIGMKLSVPLYRATATSRGANLDSIDWPLNNRSWLKAQFAQIRKLPEEPVRLARLQQLAQWKNPGPGGFYDNPGQPGTQTRVTIGRGWERDPAHHQTAFALKNWVRGGDFATHRIEWMDHAATLGDTPLIFTYEALDPKAHYELRVVYGDTKLNGPMRLVANDGIEIHPLQKGPVPVAPQTFPIPRAATQGGRLVLRWERDPAIPSIHGVCHVSEIWLIKK